MTRDRIYDYYIGQSYNCAEAVLHAANDEYGLGVPEDAFRLVSGFGGGMCCGKACGALCGGIAAISQALVKKQAHGTSGLKDACTAFTTQFIAALGSDQCDELVKTYKNERTRCLDAVLIAADVLDRVFADFRQPGQV